ncbi:MAG: peroxide stress protein YaaA [Pseudomonadota bacterium]
MIIVLSPAKTLDLEHDHTLPASEPLFNDQAATLIDVLRKKRPAAIAKLMKLSPALTTLNHQRYAAWQPKPDAAATRQAIHAFRGDVYQGLDADSLTRRDLNYAQKHLRILSGLYGVLRPLDSMQAYRLEMGTRLANPRGKDLYAFWREQATQYLASEIEQSRPKALINLASNEYFGAVDADALPGSVIAPRFLDYNRGDYRVLSFFAKRARGRMAGWLIRARIKSLKAIQDFDLDGYRYSDAHSSSAQPTFIRKKPQ